MVQKITCKFCASRCGMIIHREEGRIVRVEGDLDHPTSRGWSCARGRASAAKYHRGTGMWKL